MLQTTSRSLKSANSAAEKALDTRVVIFTLAEIEKYVERLRREVSPSMARGIHATPGLALLVEGKPFGDVGSTERNKLRRLSGNVIAAWKRDKLQPGKDVLDSSHKGRTGAWGGVSEDVARQIGGVWTSRSLRTLNGVVNKAKA